MNRKNDLLSVQAAEKLSTVATFPHYDRSQLDCGIAHMSVGNFHRSHQALFLHDYLQTHPDEPWMIHGIGLLQSDHQLVTDMHSQGHLYTLIERSGSHDTLKIIGSIKEMWHAPTDPQRVIDLLASDHIKIVSLTVTEAGYYYTAEHRLDGDHKDIKADLRLDVTPVTVLGYLFSAAEQRKRQGGLGFTIMSCDNLPGNGDLTRSLLLEFADIKNRTVGDWIRTNVAFPNSMVDRITPRVTADTLAYVRNTFGIDDPCAVMSEAYVQWVLEDTFFNGRPRLETAPVRVHFEAGWVEVQVQFTGDVKPFETIKMRLLNGSHSALAYVAYLMGHRRVDEAMQDPLVHTFVRRYMDDDITPTLVDVPDDINVAEYKATLFQRFSNPAVADQVARLAQDGSAKIRNFVVPPLKYQLDAGGSIRWIAFALAGWCTYLRGRDENGVPITIIDPMAEMLSERAVQGADDPRQLLSLQEIFGEEVAVNGRLAAEVKQCLDAIARLGTREALRQLLEQ